MPLSFAVDECFIHNKIMNIISGVRYCKTQINNLMPSGWKEGSWYIQFDELINYFSYGSIPLYRVYLPISFWLHINIYWIIIHTVFLFSKELKSIILMQQFPNCTWWFLVVFMFFISSDRAATYHGDGTIAEI